MNSLTGMPPYPDREELARLDLWLNERGHGAAPITQVRLLRGGTQNILLRFNKGGREMVMRRPPLHPRANSSEIMRREARLLAVLAGTEIPHPALIDACSDEAVIGVAFYVMEAVDGFAAVSGLPSLHRNTATVRHAMGLSMVDGAAALGNIDVADQGLSDFGKPDGFLERQVPRWLALLESYREAENWPGPADLPAIDMIVDWLVHNQPTSFTPGLMHGDFHIGNMMFDLTGPGLAAIVDWELATIGDPLLDLGWMIATWPDDILPDGPVPDLRVNPPHGFPTAAELVARYRASSSRSLDSIDWYAILACFKLAIILEGTHARACAGAADAVVGTNMHGAAINLLQRATRWCSTSPLRSGRT